MVFQAPSGGAGLHDGLFEGFGRNDRLFFDPGFIRVNRVDGIFQDGRDLVVIGDSHPHQGEYPQVRVQQLVFFEPDLVLLSEQGVEVLYEIGEKAEEDLVEALQHFFFFGLEIDVIQQKNGFPHTFDPSACDRSTA